MITKISELYNVKEDLKRLKGDEKELVSEFKEYLNSEGINKLADNSTGISVSMSKSEKVSINEDILLQELKKFIKEHKEDPMIKEFKKCIKRVETVNEDHVESLIRSGVLPASILEPATSLKVTETIRVNKSKKGE